MIQRFGVKHVTAGFGCYHQTPAARHETSRVRLRCAGWVHKIRPRVQSFGSRPEDGNIRLKEVPVKPSVKLPNPGLWQ